MQGDIERLRRRKVAAKRLLQHHAGAGSATGVRETFHHGREQRRRNGEVVQRSLRIAQRGTQAVECIGGPIVALHIRQRLGKYGERCFIHTAAVLRDTVPGALDQLLRRHCRRGHANDRNVQYSPFRHPMQRRKDFLEREITRDSEKHQRIGAVG